MALYLQFFSSYDDLQNFLTIFHLRHALLHRLCFPHINRPSGNHYFLLFAFVLLILILFCFIYTSSFHHKISHLVKFEGIPQFFIQSAYQMVKQCCCVLIECDSCFVAKILWHVLLMSFLSIKCQVLVFCLIENVSYEMVKHPSCVLIDSYCLVVF